MHLTQKGQITITKQFRDKFGLRTNVEIDFIEQSNKLILIKRSSSAHPFDRLVGILKNPRESDSIVKTLRGKA